jgi:arylformamidase
MKIFDISRPLFNGLAPWPGDTAFHYELKWKMADGATVNVGAIQMGVHNGSHADAPLHFEEGAAAIDQMPVETYVGNAVVVDLTRKFESGETREITISDLEAAGASLASAPRLLLKTGVWKDPATFPEWIPVMASDVPAWLGERKVKLLGLDVPSVDHIQAKILTNHHALAVAGIAIVESLDLSQVAGGLYRLCALPLRIAGGDAAPVRAVLWQE